MTQTKSEAKVQAWLRQIETGKIKTNVVRCLAYIKSNPYTTIYEMRTALGMPHQTLTATISLLMDEGALMFQGERQQNNEWYSALIYVSDQNTRQYIRNQRERDKFVLWLKQGERYQHLVNIVYK